MNADVSNRKRSAIVAREVTAQLFVLMGPVARPLLQQVDEHVASRKAPVERVDGLKGGAVIRRRSMDSVLRKDTEALPDLAKLGWRELGEFFHETFSSCSHARTLRRGGACVELLESLLA